jgi:lipopolysaccharide export system permease protein
MKACGNSIYRLSIPILVISLGIGLFSLATNEYMVPYATKRYKEIERFRPGVSAEDRLFKKNNIWYFGKGVIYKIQHINVKKELLHNITIFRLDENYHVVTRIDAKKASWEGDHWQLRDGTTRQFLPNLKISYFDHYNFIAEETLDTFKVSEPEPEEMTFGELNQHIEKLKRMGLDYQRYVVDLAAKVAFPLVNLIFPLIGIPFGLKTGRSSGIASGVGISIIIGFLYWVTMAFNISLGHVGVLPPFLAAFGSNIIFGLVGLIALMSVKT